jgi:pectinesterase
VLTASEALLKQKPAVYLGRPWRPYGAAAFVRCRMGPHVHAAGWDNWRNPANEKTARFAEFGSMDLDGKALDVSQRVAWSRQLTAAEAQDYTVARLLGGTDQWEPVSALTAGKQ